MKAPMIFAVAVCCLVLGACGGATLTITNDSDNMIRNISLDSTVVCADTLDYWYEEPTDPIDVEPGTYTVTLEVEVYEWDDVLWEDVYTWKKYSVNEPLTIVGGHLIKVNHDWSFESIYVCTLVP